jgi:hypothetical protein
MAMDRKQRRGATPEYVVQFLIVLPKVDPLVWRRIQVPRSYSFWDLHVAIQDAMGWKDCHLHEFTVIDPKTKRVKRIGIPDEEGPEKPALAGWRVKIDRYFTQWSDPVRYLYDFGDDWQHTVEFEHIEPADGGKYPRCVAGAGACPPEDVGGPHGYTDFLLIIRNPRHPEHRSTLKWVGGSFDPNGFRPDSIVFDDPAKRWQIAFVDQD